MKNRIGIVGGGQLARMLIFDAKKMGFTVTVLDPTPYSPAGQIADKHIVAELDDEKAMMELANHSDYITLEWEHANPDLLEKIAKNGIPVNPSAQALRIIKDKYQQKVFLRKAGIPVAPFENVILKGAKATDRISGDPIASLQGDIHKIAKKFGYPLLLKAKVGGYDGKGNYTVKNQRGITEGFKKLGVLEGKEVYVEKFIPFEKELAVMVARNTKGSIETFPVVETIHKNNILHLTIAPAQIKPSMVKKAETLAKKVMLHLKGAGVFGIEMFLTKKGDVLINEIAPRVHNSGHYTIEPCITSQFAQHLRAVTGLPLGKTDMIMPYAVMINILGKRNDKADIQGLANVLKIPNVYVHIYGKADTKIERKMGHITVMGSDLKQCLVKAKKARKLLEI